MQANKIIKKLQQQLEFLLGFLVNTAKGPYNMGVLVGMLSIYDNEILSQIFIIYVF